jgi:hypothetical protein
MGQMRDGPVARRCERWFFLLPEQGFLILDRIELPYPGRVETRLHTMARVARDGEAGVRLEGQRTALRLAYACTVPAVLRTAEDALTTPSRGADEPNPMVVRWCTRGRGHTAVTMATLLAIDNTAGVTLDDGGAAAEVAGAGWWRRIAMPE